MNTPKVVKNSNTLHDTVYRTKSEERYQVSVESFCMYRKTLTVHTQSAPQFIDITDNVIDAVNKSGIIQGTVLIFSFHTTAGIVINEKEPLLLKDFESLLKGFAPNDNKYYGHNDFGIRTVNMHEGERPNGHSHCQHIILGSSQTLPVCDGKPLLGKFQSIFLVELDEPKIREICLQVQGLVQL